MNDKWLKRICRKWQKRMGLADWTIAVAFVPQSDLEPQSIANISWNPDDMASAQMWVCRPDEIQHSEPEWYVESCIIHELGHLLLDGHREYPGHDVNTERAINKLTLALLPRRRK